MVLDLVLIGLGIAVFPLPIAAFVLVLSADRGILKGLAFIVAWLACFVAVLAVVLLATGGEPPAPKSPPSTAASALKLAIGVGLIVYGWRRRKAGRRTGEHPRSEEMKETGETKETQEAQEASGGMAARLDQISVWTAAGLGPLLQPWGLVAAGATTVVSADLSHAGSFLALFAYCLIATSGLLTMELYTTFAPDSARVRLGRLRTWLQSHQDQALVSVVLVVGLFLVGKSIYQLTS
ncbi:GAP family protein [Streptomyces sp. NPDC127069]|uniref:GAP family protein n=1 Tax=Streptomyces sp. NPDC127069 TaxID=3347128 RepID=UPI003668E008